MSLEEDRYIIRLLGDWLRNRRGEIRYNVFYNYDYRAGEFILWAINQKLAEIYALPLAWSVGSDRDDLFEAVYAGGVERW